MRVRLPKTATGLGLVTFLFACCFSGQQANNLNVEGEFCQRPVPVARR